MKYATGTPLIADGSKIPWPTPRAHYGGSGTVTARMLFEGIEDGPEAVAVRQSSCTVPPHFHLGAQFQLVVNGWSHFPQHHLDAIAVHYTDHSVAYGPFETSGDAEMLVLHAKPAGLFYMSDKAHRDRLNRAGRELTGHASEAEWTPIAGWNGARRKVLLGAEQGPSAELLDGVPGTPLTTSAAPLYGRFEYVVRGSVITEGEGFEAGSLRFFRGEGEPPAIVCGPDGATVVILTYDQDAENSYGGTIRDIGPR